MSSQFQQQSFFGQGGAGQQSMGGPGGGMSDLGNRRPLAMKKQMNQNYQRYMDKMTESLNKTLTKIYFHIGETISHSKVQRPFSTKTFGGQFFQSKANLHGNQSIDKISYLGSIHSGGGPVGLGGQGTLAPYQPGHLNPGRSMVNLAQAQGSAIGTMDRIVSALPQPKRPNTTAKAAPKKDGEGGQANTTEKRTSTLTQLQPIPEKKLPINETNESALRGTTSWANQQQILKKLSVGTVTTTKYHERAQLFDHLNEKARDYSNILPQSNYFGQTPDPMKDPYDRRKVKQLNDISFEESDEEEQEFEDVKNLKRLPRTVITEESLKQYLGVETEKINLEHHYWLKDNFIDKIGRMAPNLRDINLRRLKISNKAFAEIVINLKHLQNVDISDCPNIHSSGLLAMFDHNKNIRQLQTANNPRAVSNEVVRRISEYENLTFLDISYAIDVTDEGLNSFNGKCLPITQLYINGLTQVTNEGLTHIINAVKTTLKVIEAALMNQETVTGTFCQVLSHAFHLEEIDFTGDVNIQDDQLSALTKGDIKLENGQSQHVGLQHLKILKLSGLVKLTDHTLTKLANTSHVLEHLELTKCEGLTEYSIDQLIKNTSTLKFLDLNNIPAITPQVLELLRQIKPELLIRRYLYQVVDPKDNLLRVPRRLANQKKKKAKKGGKKKKK